MALANSVSNVSSNISKTEAVVVSSAVSVGLGTGNVFRLTLDAPSLGGPQYGFNVRIGAAGGITDNVFYSSNNLVSNTTTLTNLNNLANGNPQFTGLSSQVVAAAMPTVGGATPAGAAGSLLVVVTGNVSSNAQVSLINPAPSDGGLLTKLGAGVLASGNVGSAAKVFISISAIAANANTISFVGAGNSANATYGATPGGNAWNLVVSTTAVSNGSVVLGLLEQLA